MKNNKYYINIMNRFNIDTLVYVVCYGIQNALHTQIFDCTQDVTYMWLLYVNCFAMAYSSIITKVNYKYCNALTHGMYILFMYSYKYLEVNSDIFSSIDFIFSKLLFVTIGNELSLKYTLHESIKKYMICLCASNIFYNYRSNLLATLNTFIIDPHIYIHISCILNIIIITTNIFFHNIINCSRRLSHFDALSKKFFILFMYSVTFNIIDNLKLSDKPIVQYMEYIGSATVYVYLLLCVSIKNKAFIYYSFPFIIYTSQYIILSEAIQRSLYGIINITIVYTNLHSYQINSRLYAYNAIFIFTQSLISFFNIQNEYISTISICLLPFLIKLYRMYEKDVYYENIYNEENGIKNNIDIIINE